MAERDAEIGDLTGLLDLDGSAAGGATTSDAPLGRVGVRKLPGLIGRAARLAWRAAPGELALSVALQAICGVGVTMQLLLGRTVIGAVVSSEPGTGLGDVAPELVGLAVVTLVVGAATAVLAERQRILAALVERHVQDRILDVVAEVDLAAFESGSFHDRLRRAVVNASERSWQVSISIVSIFSAGTTLVALAVVLARVEPLVLPGVLIAYLPLHLATTRNGRASYEFNFWMTTADRERSYLGGVLMGQTAAKEIRLFGSAGWLRARYDQLYDRRITELRKVSARRMRRALLAGAGSIVVTVLGVGLLIHWAFTGRISAADAGVAALAIQQLGTRMRMLGTSAGSLHECSLFLDDVIVFLEQPVERASSGSGGEAPGSFTRLEVDHLSFTYPGTDREVLHDVSMHIGASEVVALVGANGSGKTTLAKLLCALYAPTEGRVSWDDTDLATCDPASVRRHVAAVFQDFIRYELTGHQNIALGAPDRFDDLDAVIQAAIAAGADERLASLPFAYDTRLNRSYEDGADLSIGEWQRVALARAYFRDAPFLVLDEPTASLDAHAEHELFDAMHLLKRDRAVLLISHRFSSVRSADRIYVLQAGRVIEAGTHDELMRLGGRYAEMFTLQAAAYLDDPDAEVEPPAGVDPDPERGPWS